MGCLLTAAQRADLEGQLVIYKKIRDDILAQIGALAGGTPNKRYRFDSGEGSQEAWRMSHKELFDTLERYNILIANIEAKLDGNPGAFSMRLRRY